MGGSSITLPNSLLATFLYSTTMDVPRHHNQLLGIAEKSLTLRIIAIQYITQTGKDSLVSTIKIPSLETGFGRHASLVHHELLHYAN